jgi:hypothetical protein
VTVSGVTHHLISYYTVGDVISRQLPVPTQQEMLRHIQHRPELTPQRSSQLPTRNMAIRGDTIANQALSSSCTTFYKCEGEHEQQYHLAQDHQWLQILYCNHPLILLAPSTSPSLRLSRGFDLKR